MKKKQIAVAISALLISPLLRAETTDISLDEITVTSPREVDAYNLKESSSATRTKTPIKEIPQSVIAIPRAVIEDQQNITMGEALKNASGIVTNDEFSSPAFETTRVRGFPAENLIDGFTQYYNPGDRESLVNVQSLEVLKGSNAVLFSGGSGSPVGGVVNVNSKLPQNKAFGELGIKIGTDDFVQPFFDINQPLTDKVLVRVTGEYTKAESSVDVIDQKRYNINPSLTLTNNEDTTFTFQGKVSRWKQQEYQGLPATGTVTGSIKIKDDLFIGNPNIPDSTSEFEGFWATLDHKINEQWSFNLKARYAESEFEEIVQSIVGGGGSFAGNTPFFAPSTWGLSNVNLFQKQREQSILANTTYNFDVGNTKNTLLFGADYAELKDQGYMTSDVFLTTATVDLLNPVFSAEYTDPGKSAFTTFNDSKLKNTTYGAYVQLQSNIQDRLHLLLGLRQAHVELDYVESAPSAASTVHTSKDKLLPRVGAVFDLNDSFSLFASYSQGLRSQPFTIFAANVTPEPAESKSKEAGIKFDVSDQLAGQVAFYHIDRTNVAVGFPATPNGEQRSRGFDADVTWHASSAWKILANYAYTNAEYTKDASATVVSGNQLAGVPKNSARLWANYKFSQDMLSGLSAGAGVYWQSEAHVDDANQFKADSYHTFDAAINYSTERYNLGLTIKNLTNEDYYQYYNYFGGRVRPDNGTSAYLTASFKY